MWRILEWLVNDQFDMPEKSEEEGVIHSAKWNLFGSHCMPTDDRAKCQSKLAKQQPIEQSLLREAPGRLMKTKEIVQGWWPHKWPARDSAFIWATYMKAIFSSKVGGDSTWAQGINHIWTTAYCRRHAHALKIIFILRPSSPQLIFLILHSISLDGNVSNFYYPELYKRGKGKE